MAALDTAEIIAELVNLAKNMREAGDALEVNDSAVKVLGDETLRQIALELVDAVRKNALIDWTVMAEHHAPAAVAAYQHALELVERSRGEQHWLAGWEHVLLGKAYAESGNSRSAL